MRKFSLRILTSLCVFEEHREISEAYMENTANLELFAVHKFFSEYAEREDAKRYKIVYVSFNNNTNFNFLDSFFLHYGMD